jgi:hypothetical protein
MRKFTIVPILLVLLATPVVGLEGYGTDLSSKLVCDYQVGDYGQPGWLLQVISKVSDTECLVDFIYPGGKRAEGARIVLLRGLDFSNAVDDKTFTLDVPVLVTGTYTYNSAGGSKRTVLVLDRQEYRKQEGKISTHERALAEAAIPPEVKARLAQIKTQKEAREARIEAARKKERDEAPQREKEQLEKKAGYLFDYAERAALSTLKSEQDKARERLKEIIDLYPQTEAAVKAKALLAKLGK